MDREEKKRFRLYYLAVDNLPDDEILAAWNKVNPHCLAGDIDLQHIRNRLYPSGPRADDPSIEEIERRCQEQLRIREESRLRAAPRKRKQFEPQIDPVVIPVVSVDASYSEDSEWFESEVE